MADGLSIASGVVALVTFAFQATSVLYNTVRSFQSQHKDARALKTELADLTGVLQSLLETVAGHPDIDFEALKLPLYRCGTTCEEYCELIVRCTKHSNASRPSLRDWINQQYLKGDITDFREMISGYKSTINIALANANIRIVASLTPNALEEYKDLIRDTKSDLHEHLLRLDRRVQSLAASGVSSRIRSEPEWLAMLEEKESTQQGLRLCSQLAAHIEDLESTTKEHPQFSQKPSAHKYIKSGLGIAKGSIHAMVSRLETHEEDIKNKMAAMQAESPLSENQEAQLAHLQEVKESIRQCMNIVGEAGQTLAEHRYNVFEDITMTDHSYGITVSTVKDLVIARRVNLQDQARYVGGQLSDESYQSTVDKLVQLDQLTAQRSRQDSRQRHSTGRQSPTNMVDRYGRGHRLSPSETLVNSSEEPA